MWSQQHANSSCCTYRQSLGGGPADRQRLNLSQKLIRLIQFNIRVKRSSFNEQQTTRHVPSLTDMFACLAERSLVEDALLHGLETLRCAIINATFHF